MTDARNFPDNVPSTENDGKESVVIVGKENVGKSELVAGLSGTMPTTGNVRGTTVDVERYESDESGDVLDIRYIYNRRMNPFSRWRPQEPTTQSGDRGSSVESSEVPSII
ncbi:GTPase [Halorubrum distributum]|nr:GTPase [Halorubrum distributum]MDV7350983.1 GTPase [Halorubrum distributum]